MKVLQTKHQIAEARTRLLEKGASCLESFPRSVLRRAGLLKGPAVGDYIKSWDVLATIDFLQQGVPLNAPILDIGCFSSEVVVALHKLGFTNLTGADLNPALGQMPFPELIRYVNCDFMHTPFEDASFQAITSISVIEHGFDADSLLKETSRLLKNGGYFIASFDYWPTKIDTAGTTFFGMPWTIFSEQELRDFIRQAATYSLEPTGDLDFSSADAPVKCGGRNYTFGWLVLKKVSI